MLKPFVNPFRVQKTNHRLIQIFLRRGWGQPPAGTQRCSKLFGQFGRRKRRGREPPFSSNFATEFGWCHIDQILIDRVNQNCQCLYYRYPSSQRALACFNFHHRSLIIALEIIIGHGGATLKDGRKTISNT